MGFEGKLKRSDSTSNRRNGFVLFMDFDMWICFGVGIDVGGDFCEY